MRIDVGSTPRLPLAAMGEGLRAQQKAATMRQVLDAAALLDPALAQGLRAIEAQGQAVVEGAAVIAQARLAGSLIDVLG